MSEPEGTTAFFDASLDFVYSWGILHLAPDTARAKSPGTKAYTVAEPRALFHEAGFTDITAETLMTVWDARFARRRFLPAWCRALLPKRWGWFLVIRARRPRA